MERRAKLSNPLELLNDFSTRGIQLWNEAGKLKFKTTQGRLADSDRELLRAHKAELLRYLAQKPCKQCGARMLHVEAGYYSCPNCFCQTVEAKSGYWATSSQSQTSNDATT
jgi:hypothetical protein